MADQAAGGSEPCRPLEGKTIAVDFDGVLNNYEGWQGEDELFEPRPGARDFLANLAVGLGAQVVIHSCRQPGLIWDWLYRHDMAQYVTLVTNQKPPAHAYVDDRAVRFEGDFVACLDELTHFEPHWTRSRTGPAPHLEERTHG